MLSHASFLAEIFDIPSYKGQYNYIECTLYCMGKKPSIRLCSSSGNSLNNDLVPKDGSANFVLRLGMRSSQSSKKQTRPMLELFQNTRFRAQSANHLGYDRHRQAL